MATRGAAEQPVRLGRRPVRVHEWLAFEDPDEQRTWSFDLTFLLSSWSCIFGSGCQGVLTAPAPALVQGCCSYGAHFTGPEDRAKTERLAKLLTADEWQHKPATARTTTKRTPDGELVTRVVDDACIFLNRPGFPAGPGCALHAAALNRGERPLDWKPEVCWQLPLRREDATDANGHVTSTIRQWDRRHWGAGGDDFAWWCTEDPDAFVGAEPVFVSLREELIELTSEWAYETVADHCARRRSNKRRPLPHPALGGGAPARPVGQP